LDETGEPLAGLLRPGNAGANTASDHFEVLQLILEQLPSSYLDREILVRTDIGGRTHAFTRDCREAGIRFSVSYEVDERVRGDPAHARVGMPDLCKLREQRQEMKAGFERVDERFERLHRLMVQFCGVAIAPLISLIATQV
jgi:Transposase DDE domain group 1